MRHYDSSNNKSSKIYKDKNIIKFSSRDNEQEEFESRSIMELSRKNQDNNTVLSNSIILSVISNFIDINKDIHNTNIQKLRDQTNNQLLKLSLINNISDANKSSKSLQKLLNYHKRHRIINKVKSKINKTSTTATKPIKKKKNEKNIESQNENQISERKNQDNAHNYNQKKMNSFGKVSKRRKSACFDTGEKNTKFKETIIGLGFDKKILEDLTIKNKRTTKFTRKKNYGINNNINDNSVRKKATFMFNYAKHNFSGSNNLMTLTKEQEESNTNNELMAILAFRNIHNTLKNNIQDNLKKKNYKNENNNITHTVNKIPTKKSMDKKNNEKQNDNNKSNDKNTQVNKKNLSKKRNKKIEKKNEKYRCLDLKKKVYDSFDDDIAEEIVDNLYFLPDSDFIIAFDTIVMICSFIILIYLPLYLAKNIYFCSSFLNINNSVFYFIDLIYIFDIILGFYRAFYNFDELLIRNSNDIFKNYINTWFFCDLITSIPIFSIFNFFQKKCAKEAEYLHSQYYNINLHNFHFLLYFFKAIKTFKVFNSNISMEKLSDILQENELISDWGNAFLFLFFFISSINFSACHFIFVGRNTYQSWIINYNFENQSFWNIYTAAIYYITMTVTTVGYGDLVGNTLIELIVQAIILLAGTCIYSWLISATSSYIKKMSDINAIYESKLKILDEIKLSNPSFTVDLYEKIIRLLNYRKYYKEIDKNVIIETLPYSLRNALIIEMYKPFINNLLFFKNIKNQDFIAQVVSKLKPALSVKGDILVQEGDFIEDILFVKDGLLSLEMKINLDYPDKSIEEYLNKNNILTIIQKKNEKVKKNQMTKNLLRNSEIKGHQLIKSKIFEALGDDKIFEKNKHLFINEKNDNTSFIKIGYIKKNEHFGDVYMFLNKRSPLYILAKSKKVELLLLKKLDAVSISTTYPKIWKKIMRKSLIITKKLKNLTLKMLIIFCNFHGVKTKFFMQQKYSFYDVKKIFPKHLNNGNTFIISKKKILPLNDELMQTLDQIKGINNNNKKKEKKISSVIYEEQDEETSNESLKKISTNNLNKSKKNRHDTTKKTDKKKKKVNLYKNNKSKSNDNIINHNNDEKRSHNLINKNTNESKSEDEDSSSSKSSVDNNCSKNNSNKNYGNNINENDSQESPIMNNVIESPVINNNSSREIKNYTSIKNNDIGEINDEIYPGEMFNINTNNNNNKIINIKN